jgi:hypothetical protein
MVGNLGFGFLRVGSEKGNTRKHTGNRVTRWTIGFLGEFKNSRCFTKRIIWGNLDLDFLGVLLVVPREAVEEGGRLLCFWGNFRCLIGVGRNFGEGAPLWGWDYLIREGRMTYDTMLWMGVTMR